MSDLVERLRDASSRPTRDALGIGAYWNMCDAAADEIEKLRARLEWREDGHDGIYCRDETIRVLQREVESRPKATVDDAIAGIERLIDERDALCDKALRFDLDAAGIEQRERESVELVELRAERSALIERISQQREDLERITAERDAAFAMSKCECGPEEACANLVKAVAERDAALAAHAAVVSEFAIPTPLVGVLNEHIADEWKIECERIAAERDAAIAAARRDERERCIATIEAVPLGMRNTLEAYIDAIRARIGEPR